MARPVGVYEEVAATNRHGRRDREEVDGSDVRAIAGSGDPSRIVLPLFRSASARPYQNIATADYSLRSVSSRYAANSSNSAFASFRSKPSVNQPHTGARSSRACCSFPVAPEPRGGAKFLAVVTTSDNTNNNAATNGQSLHTRRHWFAAKNPSWRSRTRSWTPRGSPPREAAGRRVKHKKMQIGALWSCRAKALTEWHWSSGRCSRPGPMDLSGGSYAANSSSSAFASFRSRVSNPSVNQP